MEQHTTVEQQVATLGQQRQQLVAQLALVEQQLAALTSVRPAATAAAVWPVAAREAGRIRQGNLRIGGIVKVPDLTDAVLGAVSPLTAPAFHGMLQQWQREDRLTLQLCNDPRLEPRAAEGIHTDCGLRYYVQLRA